MKQPPPPYCQVAMTTPNPMVSNAIENQATIMPSGIQAIPSTCDDVRNKIPPAYEENTIQSINTSSSLEIRAIPNALDHATNEASSSSLSVVAVAAPSSSSAANASNVPAAEQRQPNH